MPAFDLVRSILMRAHVQTPSAYGLNEALPQPGPPVSGPSQPDVYNPVVPRYVDTPPPYDPPAPWFEGVQTTGTPSMPPGAQVEAQVEAHVGPDAVQYEGATMDQQLFNALMQAAAYSTSAQCSVPAAPDALPDPYAVPESTQPEPDPVAVVNAVFDYQMQLVAAMAEPPAPEQPEPSMPLEQIVEQELQQMMDPGGMMAPEMMDPGMPMDPEMGPMM